MSKYLENSRSAKALLDKHLPVIVFDTETSGLSCKTNRVIQFSGSLMKWDGFRWVKVEEFERYIKPPIPISKEIIELTGITNEFLEDKESEAEVFPDIFDFLCKGRVFVGQNLSFDIKFIDAMAKRQIDKNFTPKYVIDTLPIAKELVNRSDLTEESYKLCNLAEYYMCATDGFHNASVDIQNTWDVLLNEMKDYEIQLEAMNAEIFITDFHITGMNRWQKAYSAKQRYDRMYINTTVGEVVYDMASNKVTPKKENGPNVDPEILVSEMNRVAKMKGFQDYRSYK